MKIKDLVLHRFNRLSAITNIIDKAITYHYGIMLDGVLIKDEKYTKIVNDMNEVTTNALFLAKEKITELEKEINNATSKTTDA